MRLLVSFLVVIAIACATTPASKPAPSSVDAEVVNPEDGGVLSVLPEPGAAEGAWLAYDARGAYGHTLASHLDVFPDNTARCFRRRTMKPDDRGTFTLNAEQRKNLEDVLMKNATHSAKPVARRGTIQDIGTMTITMRQDGKEHSVVTDGSFTVEPPQTDVSVLLNALLQQCLSTTPGGAT